MYKEILLNFGQIFCDLMIAAIFIQSLMTMVAGGSGNAVFVFLSNFTAPVLNLAKKITPKTGMIDFSPMIAFFGLEIFRNIWIAIISSL